MITSITPALDLIEPLMEGLLSILQNAAVSFHTLCTHTECRLTIQSWKTKIHSMPVLSLVYFRNLSLISETCKAKCLDVSFAFHLPRRRMGLAYAKVVSACLRDPNQEVREMASS